jgi:uncharacterized protein
MPRSGNDASRVVGLISDTHGLMRPEALAALHGCRHIVHAGDIGGPQIVQALEAIAPVTAVRGNNDTDAWGRTLPRLARLEVEGVRILVIHDLADLDLAAARDEAEVVVCGHSHKPRLDDAAGVLVVNPGSAGPRRFRLPICVARLHVEAGRPRVELLPLELPTPPSRTPGRTRAARRGYAAPTSRSPRR